MPRSRYRIHEDHVPHFLTCSVVNWLPIFACPPVVEIILDSWRFLQENHRLQIYAYVIMENHLHLIASSEQLSKEIGDFKSFTARKIIDLLVETNAQHFLRQLAFHKLPHKMDRPYQFWQEGLHAEWIQNDAMMRQKVDYIHQNTVKRGYVDRAEHWRYSSARNYLGEVGILEVDRDW